MPARRKKETSAPARSPTARPGGRPSPFSLRPAPQRGTQGRQRRKTQKEEYGRRKGRRGIAGLRKEGPGRGASPPPRPASARIWGIPGRKGGTTAKLIGRQRAAEYPGAGGNAGAKPGGCGLRRTTCALLRGRHRPAHTEGFSAAAINNAAGDPAESPVPGNRKNTAPLRSRQTSRHLRRSPFPPPGGRGFAGSGERERRAVSQGHAPFPAPGGTALFRILPFPRWGLHGIGSADRPAARSTTVR